MHTETKLDSAGHIYVYVFVCNDNNQRKKVIKLRIEWKGHGRGLVRGGMRVAGGKGKKEMV